jgi:hypothetical protein
MNDIAILRDLWVLVGIIGLGLACSTEPPKSEDSFIWRMSGFLVNRGYDRNKLLMIFLVITTWVALTLGGPFVFSKTYRKVVIDLLLK